MIKNGSSILLNQKAGSLPDVSSGMLNWFQPLSFIVITKTMLNGRLIEEEDVKNFRGVIQSLRGQELQVKPEGQRNWKWWQVHSDIDLELNNDDKIVYRGIEHRVMTKIDHSSYGYYEYHLVEGYQDA